MKLQSKHAPTDPLVRMLRKNSREMLLFALVFTAIFCGLAVLFFKISEDPLLHTLGGLCWLIGVSMFFIGTVGSWKLIRRAERVQAQRNSVRYY